MNRWPDAAAARPSPLRVSILTPSLNQVRWLGDNLDSVVAQDYPHVEHIVADGGSTDGSVDLLKARADHALRWTSAPDDGQADALNRAFDDSIGEIIGWLNSDDAYFDPWAVSRAVDIFETDPTVDVVYGHAALVNSDGLILQVLSAPSWAAPLMRMHNFLWQPAVFVRRSALTPRMVDPNYEFMMDWELWLRLARRARFRRVDAILAIDRHQPARKVITRQDLAVADLERLGASYRLVGGTFRRVATKILTVALRLWGWRLLSQTTRGRLAFAGAVDSRSALLRRQLTMPRARMSFGK